MAPRLLRCAGATGACAHLHAAIRGCQRQVAAIMGGGAPQVAGAELMACVAAFLLSLLTRSSKWQASIAGPCSNRPRLPLLSTVGMK